MRDQKKMLQSKAVSCGLALVLVASMVPAGAFAADEGPVPLEDQAQVQAETSALLEERFDEVADGGLDTDASELAASTADGDTTPTEEPDSSPAIGYTTEASGQTAADVPLGAAGEEVLPVAGTIEYGGLAYTIDPENPDVAMVTGLATDKPVGSVTVQSRIASDGKFYEVTSIGTSAYAQREGSVYIDELFDLAIVAEEVTEVFIPANIAHIDLAFFQLFPNACSVRVDDSNASYASAGGMLFDKSLTHLLMAPSGLGGEVRLPSEVAEIPAYAFARCSSLSSLALAGDNTSFSTMGGVLYSADGSILMAAPAGLGSTAAIPDACVHITEGAFAGNTALEAIVVQGCVQQIDAAAFPPAVPETAVVVLDVEMDEQEDAKAAWVAAGFQDFADSSPAQDTIEPSEGSGFAFEMLDDCTLEVRWQGEDPAPSDLQIPSFGIADGVRYRVSGIAPEGFKEQTSIRRVEIPAGLGRIGERAFEGATSLVEIEIPGSVTDIGKRAFAGCEALTALQLNEGMVAIDDEAFLGTGQAVLVLPASVRSVGERAFADNQSLRTVVALGAIAEVGASALGGVSDVDVYVPYDATGLYGWSVGAPAAGNHLHPYGLEMPAEPIELEVGEQTDLFGSGYIKASGAVRVDYAYKAKPISINDAGVVEAKAPGTSNIEASLTLELPAQGVSVIDEEVSLQQASWDPESSQPNTILLTSRAISARVSLPDPDPSIDDVPENGPGTDYIPEIMIFSNGDMLSSTYYDSRSDQKYSYDDFDNYKLFQTNSNPYGVYVEVTDNVCWIATVSDRGTSGERLETWTITASYSADKVLIGFAESYGGEPISGHTTASRLYAIWALSDSYTICANGGVLEWTSYESAHGGISWEEVGSGTIADRAPLWLDFASNSEKVTIEDGVLRIDELNPAKIFHRIEIRVKEAPQDRVFSAWSSYTDGYEDWVGNPSSFPFIYPQWKELPEYTYYIDIYTERLEGGYLSYPTVQEQRSARIGTQYSGGDFAEYVPSGFYMPISSMNATWAISSDNMHLPIYCKRNKYTLTFQMMNQCPCGEHYPNPATVSLLYEEVLERSEFPVLGCDHAQATRWSGDADLFEHGDVAGGDLIMPARNATLTSTWVYAAYDVTFDPNGGTGGTGTIDGDVHYGPMPPLRDFSAPTKPGYTFDGWFDRDGNKLYDRSGASVGSWTFSYGGTLYAHWKLNCYRVNEWHKNGGVGETPAVSYVYSVEERPESFDPHVEREGYELLGWSLTNDPDKIDFTSKLCLTDEFIARIDHEAAFSYETESYIDYVIDVFAQWRSLVPVSYTVSFDSNGGTGSMPDRELSANEDVRIPAASIPFLRSHYDFAGFAMRPDGEARFVPSGADGGVTIRVTDADASNGRVVLYAVWEAQLTVTAPLSVDLSLTIDASSGTVVSSGSEVTGSFESQCPEDVVLSAVRSTMVKSPAVQAVFKDGWQGVQLTFGTAGSDHDRLDLDGGEYEADSERRHVIPKLGTLDFQVGIHLPDDLRLGVLEAEGKVQLANLVYEYALAD